MNRPENLAFRLLLAAAVAAAYWYTCSCLPVCAVLRFWLAALCAKAKDSKLTGSAGLSSYCGGAGGPERAFISCCDCRLCEMRLTGPDCCEERFFMLAMADFRFWAMDPKFCFVLMITSGFCCF